MRYRNKIAIALTVVFLGAALGGCRKQEPASKPTSESPVQLDPRTNPGKNREPASTAIRQPGETLESVVEKLKEKWAGTDTMTADFLIALRYSNPTGDLATIGKATFEFQRKGGKSLFRQEIAYTITNTRDGKEVSRTEQSETSINDGKFYYVIRDNRDGVTAQKWLDSSDASYDGRTRFEKMSRSEEMTYIGQEQVNGRGVYVFEGRPKTQSTREKTIVQFDMETGMAVKSTFLGWVRQRDSSITFSNVKINPKIDPSRFRFELPDGVELVDQTNR